MTKIYNIYLYIKKWLSTTNHKDIGKYLLIKLSKLFDFVTYVLNVTNNYIQWFKYWNILIVLTWIILFMLDLLKIERILIYIILCVLIYSYKRFFEFILNKENQKKIINYLNHKSNKIYYMLIKLNEITLLTLVMYLEIKIYQLIEWYQKYDYKMYNWIILLISMLVPLKILLSYTYKFFENIQTRTMLEILWKRALGVILSVLIFTNLVQILLETYETWLNVIMFTYLYFTLNVWKDLQGLDLNNLTYFKHTANSLKLLRQRNNILTIIIKETWQEKEKVLFYEEYNKKINIINYISLDLTSYKKFKLEMQYKYLNEIKGNNILKSTKKAFLNNFNNLIIKIPCSLLFKSLNQLIILQIFFSENDIVIYENDISELISYNFLLSQIFLYIIWDYLLLNKLIIKQVLLNNLIINNEFNNDVENDCITLDFIFSEELQKIVYNNKNFEYSSINNLDDNILNELYESYIFLFQYYKNIYFVDSLKNKLFKKYYYWACSDFEIKYKNDYISAELIEVNSTNLIKQLQLIKLKFKNNYTANSIINILNKCRKLN